MSRLYEILNKTQEKGLPPLDEASLEVSETVERRLNCPYLLIDDSTEKQQEFALLYRNILILSRNRCKTLMICGADGREGASTIALNLASYLARQGGVETLLVEANFHCPTMHSYLAENAAEGFYELLVEQRPPKNYILNTSERQLYAICAGRLINQNTRYAWTDSRVEYSLNELRSCYSSIIFDAAPINTAEESLLLAKHVDGVILVVSPRSFAANVQSAKLALDKVQAKVLGVVLNHLTPRSKSTSSAASKG